MAEKETALQIRTDRDTTIVQANKLIRAQQQTLSVMEAKMLRLIISQTKKSDNDLYLYEIGCDELSKILNIPKQTVYQEAKKTVIELLKKVIVFEEKAETGRKKTFAFHWLDSMTYDKGKFTIKLSNELKPYITELKELFCITQLEDVMRLPTTYSIRLFEILESYREKINIYQHKDYKMFNIPFELEQDEIAFSIEELRKYLDCEKKYTDNNTFINRVIEPSVKAINNNNSYHVFDTSYKTVKMEDSNGKYKIAYVIFKLGHIPYKN